MTNETEYGHRSGPETSVWNNFVDFLASLSVGRLCELLAFENGAYPKVVDREGIHRAYQRYVENCRHLGTKPMPWDRALAKWIEKF